MGGITERRSDVNMKTGSVFLNSPSAKEVFTPQNEKE